MSSIILVHPQSRLIPVGAEAVFTCKFINVNINDHQPYWKVGETHAHLTVTKNNLKNRGFFIAPETISGGNITLNLRVNASYYGVNNTVIQCMTLQNDVSSDVATIMTIAGKFNWHDLIYSL